MTIKNITSQLEIYIQKEFPHFNGKFYSNRRNNYIHLGRDKSLFSFEESLFSIHTFLTEHLRSEFKEVNPPKLVISAKWKHDYIIRSRNS